MLGEGFLNNFIERPNNSHKVGDKVFKLIAIENFDAAENGIHVKHYKSGDKISTNNKEFADLLVIKGHAKLDDGLETKVIEPTETKTRRRKKSEEDG